MATFPEIFKVRQAFDDSRVEDVPSAVAQQLTALDLSGKVNEGDSVAITAGSRGIADMPAVLRGIVEHFQGLNCKPFIVPSMGSHGGGTAEGQVALLMKLGVTESSMGCPIRASMETVEVCQSKQRFPVYCDKLAFEADHVVICNRVKAHTGITGDLESGLVKMMLIGLGKHDGAKIYHRAMADYSFGEIAEGVAEFVIDHCNVIAGVGIVENGLDQTAEVCAMSPAELIATEKRLLVKAKSLMAKLPFEAIDLLLVDRMGKNISGTGIDTNVVGRKYNDNVAMGEETPRVRRIMVRELTAESRGNANGIGIADFCRSQLLEGIDHHSMAVNAITALHPNAAMIPINFDNDRDMIAAAGSTIGLTPLEDSRFVRIKDTLHLSSFYCSTAMENEISQISSLEIAGQSKMEFDDHGNLVGGFDF